MTDNAKVAAFERKLKQLKEEEQLILKILKGVQNQLKKYEVEELQTSSELMTDRIDDEESESDESIDENPESLLKVLDCAELVNDVSLNLSLNKILGKNENEEGSEEFEEDDEDESD